MYFYIFVIQPKSPFRKIGTNVSAYVVRVVQFFVLFNLLG